MTLTVFTSGTKAKASEVNDNFGPATSAYKTSALNAVNLQANGYETIANDRFIGDALLDESYLDSTSTGVVCQTSDSFIAGGTIYDNIDDSSIDSNLWTTSGTSGGTVSENTERILLDNDGSSTALITSNGSSGLNVTSGTTYVLFDYDGTNNGPTTYTNWQITNTSTTVTVYQDTSSRTRTAYLLKIDADNDLASLWAHGSTAGSWTALATDVDISTVTTNKYFRIDKKDSDSSLYKVCYYNTDADSYYIQDKTVATSTYAYVTYSAVQQGGTAPVFEVSANGGTNYTEIADEGIGSLTSGTSGKIRVTLKTNNDNEPDELEYFSVLFG